jgi:vitellogenic carboxypeptidase-like protein
VNNKASHISPRILIGLYDSQITSYAGFFQSDQAAGNNMFFWYFPAQNGDENAPLAIWLQGGPGGASTFGLFAEMGPFFLTKDGAGKLSLHDRPTSWLVVKIKESIL